MLVLLTVAVWVQIALGGWVSTNYAVLACRGFPDCNGQWWPPMAFGEGFTLLRELGFAGHGALLSFEALVAIHMVHRLFAYFLIVLLLATAWMMWRTRDAPLHSAGPAAGCACHLAAREWSVERGAGLADRGRVGAYGRRRRIGGTHDIARVAVTPTRGGCRGVESPATQRYLESAMAQTLAQPSTAPSRWTQFYALTKPRVVQLIVFCALIGMLLAVPGLPDIRLLLAAVAGIWLVAGAAAAFNCLVEQEIDSRMSRTKWRATAKGELGRGHTLAFSLVLCALGSAILWVWVNPLTMWLTFATFVGYAVVYTVVLKPLTPQNIVIGGASGAMPPVLGWAAMRNDVGPEALVLCLIIFLWTPPHFWALALYRVEDYRKAGLPMLPVTHGSEFTRLQVFLYTLVLFAATLLPFVIGMSGYVYLVAAVVLGAGFILYGWQLWREYSDALARKTFRFSIWHLSLLFAALLLDHYLNPWLQLLVSS